MICDCCMRIFERHDLFERSAEPVPHHVNTQSFVSSVAAGCPICRAILSELDESRKSLLDANTISFTECSPQTTVDGHSRERFCSLRFIWKSQGHPRRVRVFLIEKYHGIQSYLPQTPLEAHRGWNGQTVQMVRTWMHRCLEQHPRCRLLHAWRTSGSTFQPQRLVDVGATGETTWRLILREDSTISAPYATLSHRWSPGQQFKLVSKNLQAYRNGQSLNILPPVFQDTLKVIKALGIRYIWADCLCIIQDSSSDWETESLEMSKIYTNSICNISITGFEDTSTGFLDKTCDFVPLPCRVRQHADEDWYILDPYFWWAQLTKAPLTKRGWVFQERLLAPRVVHFGPEQLLWECASLDACEAFPQGIPEIVKTPRDTGFKRLDFLFENPLSDAHQPLAITEEDLLYYWCEVVQAYSRTSLTKPRDKLIALAGVAQLMSPLNDPAPITSSKGYVAGLFKQHLSLMLEWHSDCSISSRREPAGARPPQYRAPSWSWASIDGRVFYDYLPRRVNDIQKWHRRTSWEMFIDRFNHYMSPADSSPSCPTPSRCLDWRPLIFQVESSVTTTGESPFGQIVHGSLRLTGLLFLARDIITASSRHSRPILPYLDAPTTSEGMKPTTLLLPLRCVQLHSEDDDCHFYWLTGLLLDPVDASASTYQRCGMLSILSTDGVREIGIELTESPFTAKYPHGKNLETIRLV
ncbi:heterokaryon incompatibility protein-domain-containing protein [Xylaria curta]|nr:heterokaryon incompatibility protein-domain-containing protein [Xylaria curta]